MLQKGEVNGLFSGGKVGYINKIQTVLVETPAPLGFNNSETPIDGICSYGKVISFP